MRTTLTLDDDVQVLLEKLMRSTGIGLKQAVNETMRRGLLQQGRPSKRRRVHRTRSFSVGECYMTNFDNVAEVLAMAEGETFK